MKLKVSTQLPQLLPQHVSRNEQFVQVMRRFLDPDPAKRFAIRPGSRIGQGRTNSCA
jgi:hypothetical protein